MQDLYHQPEDMVFYGPAGIGLAQGVSTYEEHLAKHLQCGEGPQGAFIIT